MAASKACTVLGTFFLFLLTSFHMASASSLQEDDDFIASRRELSVAKNIKKLIPTLYRFFKIYNTGLTIADVLKMTIPEIEGLIKGQCHSFTLSSMDVQYSVLPCLNLTVTVSVAVSGPFAVSVATEAAPAVAAFARAVANTVTSYTVFGKNKSYGK